MRDLERKKFWEVQYLSGDTWCCWTERVTRKALQGELAFCRAHYRSVRVVKYEASTVTLYKDITGNGSNT